VLKFEEPFPVTVELVGQAAAAIMAELGVDMALARDAAMSALFAGRKHALERDTMVDRLRAENDRLRKHLARAERELECHKENAPGASV